MYFNEDTRVKIPAIITLTRLGYGYLSLKQNKWDEKTNIFTDIFYNSIKKINPNIDNQNIEKLLINIQNELDYDDLGRTFYKRLLDQSDIKLVDFEDFSKNTFNVVTELTCKNGEDEFRPDITILVNGMPLAFIEVKKPNNRDGILAERNRINARFQNAKFRRFINISQILMFSNNMEYDESNIEPLQGAFYCSSSKSNAFFNQFKEEVDTKEAKQRKAILFSQANDLDENIENFILKDTNYSSLKNSVEFQSNKSLDTPTNRTIVSLFSKERLKDLLRYSLAYVEYTDDEGKYHLEKHIMRYPQFFASLAIQRVLDCGVKKGVIWHTQGSGKTALAFFNVHWLTDYFQKQNVIPKFYFIVDRIDLKEQAQLEFLKRGLCVRTVDSKSDFVKDIKNPAAVSNDKGEAEITVLNIQKFSDDAKAVKQTDYAINTQRIYFIDEAHRSYNPKGSFLANLLQSDPNAIIISLTGTPLLRKTGKLSTTDIFGNYIHKYYYNQSIADGYTLKLIREDIETNYKIQLKEALKDIEIVKGSAEERKIYAHNNFITPMLEYIVNDLKKSRIRFGDDTIGGMVVCHSSEQAKALYDLFSRKYAQKSNDFHTPNLATLILCDIEDKDYRKEEIKSFKNGKIDLLFVYNMLLTGFDAPRLKKIYLNRQIGDHNLLQTLTRVNRPYKDFRYGYVVDFVDIRNEFDKANVAYWKELQSELGDDFAEYNKLFKDFNEIDKDIADIKDKLWRYDTQNSEEFSKQMSSISDRKTLIEIKKALDTARELYNVIRLSGYYELLNKLDFTQFKNLLRIIEDRIALVNLKEKMEAGYDTSSLLNEAMEDVLFSFVKRGEEELKLADDFKDKFRKTREALRDNIDHNDIEWIKLRDQLEAFFKGKNFEELTQEDINKGFKILDEVYKHITELNRKNSEVLHKYSGDAKFVRVHNSLVREHILSESEAKVFKVLNKIKQTVDDRLIMQDVLSNENVFSRLVERNVILDFENNGIDLPPETASLIKNCIVKEYVNERDGILW